MNDLFCLVFFIYHVSKKLLNSIIICLFLMQLDLQISVRKHISVHNVYLGKKSFLNVYFVNYYRQGILFLLFYFNEHMSGLRVSN